MINNQQVLKPLCARLIVSHQDGKPYLMLRKKIDFTEVNFSVIKDIIHAAYFDLPLNIYPNFKDKMVGISTLCEKGLLYYNNQTKKFEFNF